MLSSGAFWDDDAPEQQRPEGPHDIAELANDLKDPDSVDPQEVYNAICDIASPDTAHDAYLRLPVVNVPLSSLGSTYSQSDERRALQRLRQRSNLLIDPPCTIDVDDPDFCFSVNNSFLDFFMVIGKTLGIQVFIPTNPTPMFTVTLDLHVPIKQFNAKYGNLGFNPTGSMLYVGHASSEDLWIAMVPHSFHEQEFASFHLQGSHGDTRLSAPHYRILVTFFADVLSKVDNRPFLLHKPYGIDLNSAEPQFSRMTNIMYVSIFGLGFRFLGCFLQVVRITGASPMHVILARPLPLIAQSSFAVYAHAPDTTIALRRAEQLCCLCVCSSLSDACRRAEQLCCLCARS
jgi:hypothetical protein